MLLDAYDPDRLDRRDPALIAALLPALELVHRRYLRLEVDGIANIPAEPALFVGNHNGGIAGPDLLCTLPVLWRALGDAPLYALTHDFAMTQLTVLGRLLQRLGSIRASHDNAVRVLGSGGSVLVYPGGDLDAYRHFRRRNEVVILPRCGFVRVAQAAGAPIVPVVAEGAHRSACIFAEGKRIARFLHLQRWGRLQRFPLALALPWGLAAGPWLPYLPLPSRIRLRVLPPMRARPGASPETIAAEVQSAMQRALTGLAGACP